MPLSLSKMTHNLVKLMPKNQNRTDKLALSKEALKTKKLWTLPWIPSVHEQPRGH